MKTYMESFCKWLDTYLNFEKTPKKNIFWLDTMNFLAQRLGDPQKSCPCFHVAGSKGKGSVSAMITSILSCAGYRTGLYTSPHILNFTERVQSGTGDFPTVSPRAVDSLSLQRLVFIRERKQQTPGGSGILPGLLQLCGGSIESILPELRPMAAG